MQWCPQPLSCGHACKGVALVPAKCTMRCLEPECDGVHGGAEASARALFQTGDDECAICLDELRSEPCVCLDSCGHVWHAECLKEQLAVASRGIANTGNNQPIKFGSFGCGICHRFCKHAFLADVLDQAAALRKEVLRDALVQAAVDSLHEDPAITDPSSAYFNDLDEWALHVYSYWFCASCRRPFFGGRTECSQDIAVLRDLTDAERLCPNCQCASAQHKECPPHGLVWKCRLCCAIATRVSFGSVHLCEECHADSELAQKMQKRNQASESIKCSDGECELQAKFLWCTKGAANSENVMCGAHISCERLLLCMGCESTSNTS
ncbi:E3 ubiquitin-protein ligase MYCBP2 [Porphyridium purpureum]|uniref:E3 ubiquitin-protein ligase MYCBP2 n=1 Tax=Porphyridium purpureum TaxID=35688 RepID=A0A5J4Z0Y6_PORPP|nr:E3 ubiquitin-protein ligase MYCBP2 [Porphyridium purpureum]|eukprot:POR5351..scf208_2